MNETAEFLIRIIVEAQNRIASTMTSAAAQVDKLTAATERQAQSADKIDKQNAQTKKSISELQKAYADYTSELEKGNREADNAVDHLKQFQREFQALSRKTQTGSGASDQLIATSKSIEGLIGSITAAQKEQQRQVDVSYQQAAEVEKAYEQLESKRTASAQQGVRNRQSLVQDLLDHVRAADAEQESLAKKLSDTEIAEATRTEVQRVAVSADRARKEQAAEEENARRQEAINRQGVQNRKSLVDELLNHVRSADAQQETLARKLADTEVKESARIESLRASSRAARDIEDTGIAAERSVSKVDKFAGSLRGIFGIDTGKIAGLREAIDDVDSGLDKGSYTAIRFAGTLRSLIYVGAFVFFQELAGAAIALGGALVAVASAAVQAGGALAAMAAVAASQAIPVIGLLGAAWGRVGAVFQAVKQHQKNLAQAQYESAQAADRARTAADAVRSAQEGLDSANERATQSQEALNQAREDGVRQLEDLITAQRKAELQAEQSSLALTNAQAAFSSALSGGDIGNLAGRAIDIRTAREGVSDSGTALTRAREDYARTGGTVEGLDSVKQAEQAVKSSGQAVEDAARQLEEAQKRQSEGIKETSAGVRTLQQMLAQLSPAERDLYNTLNRLYKRYLDVFVGDKNHTGILGGIIEAFTEGAQRIYDLLGDQRLIKTAKRLADTIGDQLKGIFDSLTSPGNVHFLEDVTDEARKNLPVIVSGFKSIFTFIRSIVTSATPAFDRFIRFLGGLITQGAKATSSDSGLAKLGRFFDKGEEYAESITNLAIAVAQLFGAIIGASAQEGQGALDAITEKIQEATNWIRDHHQEVTDFFKQAISASGAIAAAVGDIAVALFGLFNEDHVKAFARAFSETLLPAIETIASAIGIITQLFLVFAGTQTGSAITQFLITFGLLTKVFGTFSGFFLRLGREISLTFGSGRFVGIFNTLLRVAKPLQFALAAIVAAVAVLNGDLPTLNSLLKVLAGYLSYILLKTYGRAALTGAIELLRSNLLKLAGAELLTKLGPLGRFFSTMLTNVSSLLGKLPGLKGAAAKAAETGAVSTTAGARRVVITDTAGRVVQAGETAAVAGAGARGAGAAAAGAKGAGLAAADIAVPVAVLVGLIDYISTNGGVLQRLQKVASDFTFGLIPGPKSPAAPQVPGLDEIARRYANLRTPATSEGIRDTAGNLIAGGAKPQITSKQVQDALRDAILGKASASDVGILNLLGIDPNSSKEQLQQVSDGFGDVAKKIDSAHTSLDNFQNSVKAIDLSKVTDPQAVAEFLSNLQRLKTGGVRSLTDLRRNVQFNIDQITKGFEAGSADWTAAMAKNFEVSQQVVKQAMKDHVISVKDGLKEIKKLFREEFALYGFSTHEADQILKGQSYIGGPEEGSAGPSGSGPQSRLRAVGGWIGEQGQRGADKVNTWLGRGEAVLNWAHQKVVEPAMQSTYGFGLDGLFKRVRGEHAGGGVGGMAGGGRVAGALSGVHEGVRKAAELVLGKFPLTVTSTTGGQHAEHSYHPLGEAVDIAGAPSVMDRAAAWIRSSGLFKSLAEGIHNPNLSVKFGKLVDPSFWGAETWAGHANHIHLAVVGAIGKLVGSISSGIKRVLIGGRGGAASAIGQRGLDAVRAAASDLIQRAAGASPSGSDSSSSDVPSFSGDWVDVMAKIAEAKGWNLADWKWVVGHESGGRVSIKNPTSTAFGLGQLLDSTYAKYGGGPGSTGSEQIEAMAKYIEDRYENPTAAKSFWQGHNWYAKGGAVLGKIGQAVPIVAHAGEWVVNQLQQSKLANLMGTGVGNLRNMLGFSGGPSSFAGGGTVAPYTSPAFVSQTPGSITTEIDKANSIIAKLRSSVINSKFTDALSKTLGALLGDGGLFDQLERSIQAFADKLQTNLSFITYKIDDAGNVVQSLDAKGIANRTIANLKKVYVSLSRAQNEIELELARVAERLADPSISKGERDFLKSAQKNLRDKLGTIKSEIADNLASTFQAVEDAVQAQVDKTANDYSRYNFGLTAIERMRKLAGSLADSIFPSADKIGEARAAGLRAQAAAVQKAANDAAKAGHTDTYNALIQQVQDLQIQAYEAVEAGLQQAGQDIQDQAQRQSARIDLSDRVADLLQKAGNTAGAYALRGANLAQRGSNLTSERDRLAALQQQAGALGQVEVFEQLGDQVADLDVQIQENTQAIKDNSSATRQAALDQTLSRSGFLGGVFQGLQGIVTGLGQLSGVTDIPTQRGLLQAQGTNLAQTGGDLATQLLAYGIDIRGQSPAQIIQTLSHANFAGIEGGLDEADRTVFENIVNAVIANTASTVDNSNALAQLNGSMSQAFSSTAWQRFRLGVFNGANGLLPQYSMTVPSAAVGAVLRSDGLIYGHSGERLKPASVGPYDGESGGDTYITNITSPTEVLDETDVGRKIAFARNHS